MRGNRSRKQPFFINAREERVVCLLRVSVTPEKRTVGRRPENAIRIADKSHLTRLAGERVGRQATLDTDRPGVKRVDGNRHRRKRGNSQNGGQNMHRQESLSWFAWRQQSTTSDIGRYVLMDLMSMTAARQRFIGGRNG